jgi:hypothetical protein
LSCDPGQAAVQCCPYLAVRRCIASWLPPSHEMGRPEARNCQELLAGAWDATRGWCVLRLDQETVAVLLSTLQLLRSL